MYDVLKEFSWTTFFFKVGDKIPADVIGDEDGKLPQAVIETLLSIGNIAGG